MSVGGLVAVRVVVVAVCCYLVLLLLFVVYVSFVSCGCRPVAAISDGAISGTLKYLSVNVIEAVTFHYNLTL